MSFYIRILTRKFRKSLQNFFVKIVIKYHVLYLMHFQNEIVHLNYLNPFRTNETYNSRYLFSQQFLHLINKIFKKTIIINNLLFLNNLLIIIIHKKYVKRAYKDYNFILKLNFLSVICPI